jgi:folylpolyglutamate synthase/dihydropteroate synthase
MNDKDVTGMLRKLLPVVGPVIVTGLGNTRAMDPKTIENKVIALEPEQEVIKVNNPTEALKKAFLYGSIVCVTGSFFLVGTVREQLQHRAILQ